MTTHSPRTADDIDTPLAAPAPWTVARAVHHSNRPALLVAALVAVAMVVFAVRSNVPAATALTVVALLPAVLVDVIDRRLPNRMVLGAAVVGGTVMLADIAVGGDVRLTAASLGAIAMAGPLLGAHLVSPASMGFGDVKFAVVLGGALGLLDPVAALFSLALGSFVAAALAIATRRRHIAFGPALLFGAVLVLAVHASDLLTFADTSAALSTGRTR